MSIQELIKEACDSDSYFKFKYNWRVKVRKKVPDLDWLMSELEEVLGYDVQDAARKHINEIN